MSISFPAGKHAFDPNAHTVNFGALVNGKELLCRVTPEALQDRCGAPNLTAATLLQTFVAKRALVIAAAFEKIASNRLEQDGTVLVRSTDFDLPAG